MKVVKLGEIGKIITGCTPSTKKSEYYASNDYMFVGPSDIKNVMYVVSSEKHISEKAYEDYKTRFINENSIVVDCIGSDMGNVAIIKEKCLTNQQINAITNIDESNYNIRYVYYVLSTMKNYFHLIGTNGSTMPILNKTMFENIEIEVPDIETQDKIANVLSKLDDKIKLNNEINNNLHELINQQYSKYLKENDDFEELDIKDIFEFEAGVEPGSKNYLENIESDTIYFYRVGDMNSECRTFIKRDLAKGKYITENDIVVSFDATIGRIGYGLNGSYSTGMKKVSVKDKYKDVMDNSIVYAYFNNNEVQNIMKENARGTTILHASSSIDFMKFKYNKLLLKKYSRIISISFEKMKNIKKENEKLLELRDVLLPKLMNGEIDLESIEI